MSYVRSLVDHLAEKSPELARRLPEIEKQARRILEYSQAKFPYYTPHGFSHSENVLENLNWLLPEEVKAELNAQELFFLIVAAWLHDWGMVGEPHESAELIRENHHIRTEDKLEKHFGLVRLSLNEARVIGRVCRGHRVENLYDEKYDDTSFETGVVIHVRFLAAVLRIADEVDVTFSRVPEIIYYELNPTEKAEEEFKKQLNITGIAYPSEREKYKLTLSGIAWDPLAVAALNKLKDKIQAELNHVKTILATGVKGKGLMLDYIDLKIVTRGFMKDSIEFEVDKQKILDLLIGRSLYPRKDVALRELLQNSIDACRMRRANEGQYSAEISVTIDKDTLIVEDNGIGMDFTTAKKYLSLIGSSFYSSEEFKKLKEENKGFDPISRWGLGILSSFLVSSKVVIETKKVDKPACRFIISGVDKGWRYESSTKNKCGTIVTLTLNGEGQSINFVNSLMYYIKKSEFPIFLINKGKKSQIFPAWNIKDELSERLNKPELKELIQEYGKPSISFQYEINNDEYETSIYGFRGLILLERVFRDNFLLSFQGIRTNMPSTIARRSGLITVLNIKRNVVDIDVSREFLIDNKALRTLVNKIFVEYLNRIRDEFDSKNNSTSVFEKDYNWLQFLSHRDIDEIFSYLEKGIQEKIMLDVVVPIITSKNLFYDKIINLVNYHPKSVIIFDCSIYSEEQVDLQSFIHRYKSLIQTSLKNNEIALLRFGPLIYRRTTIMEDFFKAHKISLRNGNLEEYAVELSKAIVMPIDSLLPKYCQFGTIPGEFGSSVVKSKEFRWLGKKDRYMEETVGVLGICLVFKDVPQIFEKLHTLADQEDLRSDKINEFFGDANIEDKIRCGHYLIDKNNPLVKLINDNAEKILNDESLSLLAKIALRSLVLSSKPTPFSGSIFSQGILSETDLLLKQSLMP